MSEETKQERSLSKQLADREITAPQWHTLAKSLYPGAQIESVLMVIDYCRSRGLDPLKKPCHIVPMSVKVGNSYEWRDVIMPGIYEYRTTAQKTHEYLGHSVPEYGPVVDFYGTKAPEYCSLTVYRWNPVANMRAEYPVSVLFSEVVALKDGKPNQRWSKAPRQMLTKCAEAAGLREAFPDELGGEMTFEEMVDQPPIDADPQNPPFVMSKVAVTKIVNAMNAAIAAEDWPQVWQLDQELADEERDYVWKKLDRWREQEWADAMQKARATVSKGDAVEPDISGAGGPVNGALSEKDQRREDQRKN